MQKISSLFTTLSVLSFLLVTTHAAADIEWSGVYRFEGNFVKNSDLNDRKRELTYGTSHLVLRPKIVAGDGLTVYGQFNVFNSAAYPNSQLGQVWGSGVGAAPSNSAADSNVFSENQQAETIEVSQLYLTLTQEYGALLAGRAPIHFGLGMTHNAGRGLFDHWYDTRDLVGYKFVVGNMYFLPMFGKVNEGLLNKNDDLNDYMIQAQYENPETDIELGVFYQVRKGGDQASDAPVSAVAPPVPPGSIGGTNATLGSGVNIKTVNLYALRDSEHLRLGLEASFQSGDTGVNTAGGEKVSIDGYGIAGELEWRPEGSRWSWGLKAGIASGDDPTTDAKFEGFFFDQNYDVGMLLFNRPMGQADFLRTDLLTGGPRDADGVVSKADVETVSNVLYIAPKIGYRFNDRWSLDNTFITGRLGTSPLAGDVADDLGYEWDISLNFAPRKGIMWMNQMGILMPGSAWEGVNGQYESSMGFGFTTKAAISF